MATKPTQRSKATKQVEQRHVGMKSLRKKLQHEDPVDARLSGPAVPAALSAQAPRPLTGRQDPDSSRPAGEAGRALNRARVRAGLPTPENTHH